MEKTHIYIIRRYLLLLVGLAIMAFGVAFSIKASLGTSPISSVPYVVSLFAPLTVGTATIIMHCVFILLQILILRKKYHPIQLMQLPVAFFFGYLTDFGVWAVQGITCDHYLQQWLVCLIGIFLVAVGVSLEVKAGVVVLAGEGVVLAICKVLPVKFGYMKVGFDVTLVAIACVLSFVFTGRLQGVREGTVAAALLVGGLGTTLYLSAPGRLRDGGVCVAAALCVAVLCCTFAGPGMEGVHRWIRLGPVSLNAAFLCVPVMLAIVERSVLKGEEHDG